MNCKRCGKEIQPNENYHKSRRKYCSDRCQQRDQTDRYYLKYPEKYLASKKAQNKRYWERYPEKRNLPKDETRAHSAVHYAVEKGSIIKPKYCQRCGSDGELHGHHYRGYDHPLVVIWLCRRCHGKAHTEVKS